MTDKYFGKIQDREARDYPLNVPKVKPEPQRQKQVGSNARESVVPNRPMENSNEKLTEIVLNVCSVRPRKTGSKRISRQRQTKKREDNIQSIIVNSENGSSSLHSAADSRRRGAMQAQIDGVSVSDGVNRFNGTNKLLVREEIDILAKQTRSKFSDMGNHNDEDI